MAKKIGKKVGNVIIMERSKHISEGSNYRFGLDFYDGLLVQVGSESNFNLNSVEKIKDYMKEMKWA